MLVAGYAALVALLVSGLDLSGTVAAALAAAAAALALAPLRNVAQRTVNRLMYGDRDDPAGVLARPRDADAGRHAARRGAARRGRDRCPVAAAAVRRDRPRRGHGRVSARCRARCAGRNGAHRDADATTERRSVGCGFPNVAATTRWSRPIWSSFARWPARSVPRSRPYGCMRICCGRAPRSWPCGRTSGAGCGAISTTGWDRRWRPSGLKAGLAAREVPPESAARGLLGEIDTEVKASLARRTAAGRGAAAAGPGRTRPGRGGAVPGGSTGRRDRDRGDRVGAAPPLPAAIETAAYRIAVEAMTNAVRHSGADALHSVDLGR